MKQKHFIDIEHIREQDTELRLGNYRGFEKGDLIQISEKKDGSNGCAAWNNEDNCMMAWSRKQELSFNNTLNGFWNYIQSLPEVAVSEFKKHPNWRVFGEVKNKNKIRYDEKLDTSKWLVYDIYDTESEQWLKQDVVKEFCEKTGLEYIHVCYEGEFISWEHCRSFMNNSAYGDRQEGIVVKNQSKLYDDSSRNPTYLKIVNESFRESMKTKEKIINQEAEAAKAEARKIVESIVTKNRVEKELFKMRDEQIVPEKMTPVDMKTIAQTLPKRIYEDCLKEEKELVVQCGELFGKMCQQVSMSYARDIVCGV